jgi:hypothetical protein
MKIQSSLLIIFLLPGIANAQLTVDTARVIATPVANEMKKRLSEYVENEKKDTVETSKLILPPSSTDPRLDSFQLISWENYYEYMTHGYKHRKNVFSWQLVSSKIIFFVVIFLVLMGIYFAWLQFIRVIYKDAKTIAEELKTELTASPNEFKVSSPVLGVIILLISLMFFFLYLKYVYPITELF